MNGFPTRRNERPLKNYAALEYILLGDLRDLLEEVPSAQTNKWVVAVLDALLEALPNAFRIKAEGGYLEEVLMEHPNWEPHVARLEMEYDSLCEQLAELRDRILSRAPVDPIAGVLRIELREWMQALQAYHRHENRLIQTAVNLEVGVGD